MMHREDHSNRARCSLEQEYDKMVQDRIDECLHGTAVFSLTAFIVADFGLVTCLSPAC